MKKMMFCGVLENKKSFMKKSQYIPNIITNRPEQKHVKEDRDFVFIRQKADIVDYDAISGKPSKAAPTKKTMKQLDFDLESLYRL